MKKQYYLTAMALLMSMLVTACGSSAGMGAKATANTAETTTNENVGNKSDTNAISDTDVAIVVSADMSDLFSNRDLSGEYDAAACDNITLSDSGCTTDSKNVTIGKNGNTDTVTITGGGDYMISGSFSDGMIIVDVDKTEKVQLVLNGVNVKSSSSAAIYVRNADKVFVTLADGTENVLENGGSFAAIDDNNIDAVIFSKDDLTCNGTGKLTVNSPAGHGIVSKNELTIADGNYEITASAHGMTGKDSVAIADGTFRITAGEDAIKSDNNDDTTKGSVYIFGGNYLLSAGSDGINALNEINVSGGKIVVEKSNEGLEARVINISGGETDVTSDDDGLNATDKRTQATAENAAAGVDTRVGKGFGGTMDEAYINISGGILRVNAEGDGLDSNGHLIVSGGETYIAGSVNNGDSAIDYEIDAVISGGVVVGAGQGGMAQNFGGDSTQGAILINMGQTYAAGSEIALLDSAGKKIVSWTAEKQYNSVVISCTEIKDGETYTVRTGETDTSVTMDGLIYGQGGQMGGRGGGNGGKRGFKDGTKPERMPDGTEPERKPKTPEGGDPDTL